MEGFLQYNNHNNQEAFTQPEEILVDLEAQAFTREGEQTKVTPEIEGIASRLEGSVEKKIQTVLAFAGAFSLTNDRERTDWRARSAAEILSSRICFSQADVAVLAITLLRAAQIPAKYVEAVKLETTSDTTEHVYIEVFDTEQNEWVIVDPIQREIDVDPGSRGERIVAVGLDPRDVGLASLIDWEQSQQEITD